MLESGEMYLETILVLHNRNNIVRSVDIAEEMEFSKPSVSRAMGKLRSEGYILMDPHGYITLTETGRALAEKIYERHQVLSQLLTDMGVTPETAVEDACRMEHVISDETFNVIKAHIRRFKEAGHTEL